MSHLTSKIVDKLRSKAESAPTARMSLKGKVALVTGGSKGIGAAVTKKLVSEGASVVVNYGRDSAAADALVKEIGADHVFAIQGDAGKITDIEKMVKATVDQFGKIDILMPNAGTMPMVDLEHITEEVYDRVMALNLKGPMFLAQVSLYWFGHRIEWC